MDELFSENTNAQEWCEKIIKRQEQQVYNSLTSPRDLNHIVKEHVQMCVDYMKAQGKTSMKDAEQQDSKIKEALDVLLVYLRKHEVWKPSREKPLEGAQLEAAFDDLYIRCPSGNEQGIDKYIKSDRLYSDPQVRGQNYALFSFNPTNGANPDKDGFYGFIKVRGVFNRLEEAEEKSKELIKHFSAKQIFVCEVGSPTPLQANASKENVVEVENTEQDEHSKYTELIKEQGIKEKQQIDDIKKRVEALKEDVKKDPNEKDPMQIYLELNQKRATHAYLYMQHKEKLEETKNIVLRTRTQIAEMDEKYPNLKEEFIDHYKKTCEECGINRATDDMAVMIKKYFGHDPEELGF